MQQFVDNLIAKRITTCERVEHAGAHLVKAVGHLDLTGYHLSEVERISNSGGDPNTRASEATQHALGHGVEPPRSLCG